MKHLAVALICVTTLSACGGGTSARSMLGLDRNAPDEFAVVTNAPLSLPPDYAMRPPQPGARPTQQQTTTQEARTAVTGAVSGAGAVVQPTGGTSSLLQRAGVGQSNANIRQLVDQESAKYAPKDQGTFEKILTYNIDQASGTKEDPVIDPSAEQARIREWQAKGSPVTGNAAEVIDDRDENPWWNLFGW